MGAPLILGCVVVSVLAWIDWVIEGGEPFGIPYPVLVMVALTMNTAMTVSYPRGKRRIVAAVQRHLVNPIVRGVVTLGVPLGWSLLETSGRTTGRRRVVPVGNGHEGDRFWIVAEHGLSAGYVRNLLAEPRVRVQVRSGMRMVWRPGVAHVLLDDEPARRQRLLVGWRHPLRALNSVMVNVLAVDPVTIRIDLDQLPECGRGHCETARRHAEAVGPEHADAVPSHRIRTATPAVRRSAPARTRSPRPTADRVPTDSRTARGHDWWLTRTSPA